MCIFVCNQLCLYLTIIMKLFFTLTDKDHQATNTTTADRVNEAEANGSVMKNRNSTTGVNLTSTTAADVKIKSPIPLESGSGNTQSVADGEYQKGVQSQLNASKTSNSTQSSLMENVQAGNGTETKNKKKSCFFGLCWGK